MSTIVDIIMVGYVIFRVVEVSYRHYNNAYTRRNKEFYTKEKH